MSRLAGYVTGPSGATFRGRHPNTLTGGGEAPYIAELGRHVAGLCEVALPLGRADVASESRVFEVEPARQWREGARQVMGYAAQTGLAPCLALFGRADYLPIYLFLRDRLPQFPIELWMWRGSWVRTTSRREAVLKYCPPISDVVPARRQPQVALPRPRPRRCGPDSTLPWDEWRALPRPARDARIAEAVRRTRQAALSGSA